MNGENDYFRFKDDRIYCFFMLFVYDVLGIIINIKFVRMGFII